VSEITDVMKGAGQPSVVLIGICPVATEWSQKETKTTEIDTYRVLSTASYREERIGERIGGSHYCCIS
jgi:hypothetical protein